MFLNIYFFAVFSSCSNNMKKMNLGIISPFLTLTSSGIIDNNDKIHSQFDAKYSFMGGINQSFNYFLKLEHTTTEHDRNLSGAFALQMSQLQNFNVNLKARCAIKSGSIEASSSLNIGQNIFNFDTDNIITFAFVDQSKKYDIRSTFISSSHHIDVLLTERFELRRNFLVREAHLRLTPTFQINSKTEVGYSPTDGYIRVNIDLPDFELSQELSYTKIAHKYYTAKVRAYINIYIP